MDNQNPNESVVFLWRRLSEECPSWAIGVPVLFAFLVVGLIVIFRQERKLIAALVGTAIVSVIALVYLPLAYLLRPLFSWMVILLPVMAVALFYVGLMYIRDARSVHPIWAIFLGLVRCCVYFILAIVFLLPGCQYSEKQEYESKVIFLFDVSGSMYTVDDVPELGKEDVKPQTRQDQIFHLLTADKTPGGKDQVPFLKRVLSKSQMTAYRFGPVLDETDFVQLNLKTNKTITDENWKKWLNPSKNDIAEPDVAGLQPEDEIRKEKIALYNKRIDMVDLLRSGTNIGGACLAAHKLENNSHIQAIVVISDGQSNLGSDDARSEFLNRIGGSSRREVPVITIGVGQFRQPASISIDDLQAPQETRPDDKFPVRVPVVGRGLHDEEFTVKLEVTRMKDVTGKAILDPKTFVLPEREGKFKGAGDNPQDLVQFEVDVQDLLKIKAVDDKNSALEGEWHIVARVPRNAKESSFREPEHVTKPTKVLVQKRALRVLLFAGGATREYQFVRTILFREMAEKRMEMCIYLQTGKEDHIDQDVEPERMLADFPGKLGPNDPGQNYMSLNDYDAIIAFDPDWSKLRKEQLVALREWVGTHAGGIVFVAGPVFMHQIARPGGRDIDALLSIFPVVLKDNRLHSLGVAGGGLGHDTSRPYALNFPPGAKEFDFLKLDEAAESPTAGWNGFFFNDEKFKPEPGKDLKPRRGFFYYYPIERLKPDSAVAATFAGPKESRINAGKDEQPFIVSMRFGGGKSLYVGSGEFWRLRAFKDGFHERLWIKMLRYVAAGAIQQKKYGRILMARTAPIGLINFEAQIKGKDFLPLSREQRPTVDIRKIGEEQDEQPNEKEPAPKDKKDAPKDKEKKERKDLKTKVPLSFDLQPKPFDGEWQGYFIGNVQLKEPGEYEFRLRIPGTGDPKVPGSEEMLKQSLIVRKPNPELDNVRTNFGYLYNLASESSTLLNRLPADVRKEIEPLLEAPRDQAVSGTSKRLFFPVSSADAVAKCIIQVQPKSDTVKGKTQDLWDEGWISEKLYVNVFWSTFLAPLVIGLIGLIILLVMRQWISAVAFFGVCLVGSVIVAVLNWNPLVAFVLVAILGTIGTLAYLVVLLVQQQFFGALIWLVVALGGLIVGVFYGLRFAGFLHEAMPEYMPLGFSYVMVAIVGLIGIEWLTRKLLRLA